MEVYGITIISDNCVLTRAGIDGKSDQFESSTFVNPNQSEVINYALSKLRPLFNSFCFEDGVDENEKSVAEYEAELEAGHDIRILGAAYHVTFEFFKQDMAATNIINRDDYIVTKLWCEEDIRMRLIDNYELEGTDEEVAAVINTGYLETLNDCTDTDWSIIDYAIETAGLA